MRFTITVSIAILLLAGICAAQSLDGRKIIVKGGEQASVDCPLVLPFDGKAPDTTVQVVDAKSNKAYPATICDKQLTFIPGEIKTGEEAAFAVKVLKESQAPKVALSKKGDQPEIEVVVNGEPFTAYRFSNDEKKPYLWPVYAEGKVTITRNWPMDPNADTDVEHDHKHQKSIWTAYGDINGVDCWSEEPNSGFQHSDEVTFGSGDAFGWIKAKNTWQDKDHKPVIAEEREYRFYATPENNRILDVKVTFTAAYGDALFKDTKEGGIVAFRIRPEMQEEYKKIVGKSPDGKNKFDVSYRGTITNASGAQGMKDCWGKPSPWCDYSGPIEGVGVRGIAVFDNAQNLRHPTCWHVRNYGLNGASCFGLAAFTAGDPSPKNGDYTLPSGKSLTFNYRMIIHSGDVKEAKIADRYADYATPPKADWAK